jgi:hypothetical protein
VANRLDAGGAPGFHAPAFGLERLPGAFDGVPLFVEEMLDAQQQLDVLAAVQAVAGAGFLRLQHRKLGLPKAQHIGLDT